MDKGMDIETAKAGLRAVIDGPSGKYWAHGPAISTLIAALEQSQQGNKEQSTRIDELESQRQLAFMACNRWRDKCAELEARSINVKRNAQALFDAIANPDDAYIPAYVRCLKVALAGGTVAGSE